MFYLFQPTPPSLANVSFKFSGSKEPAAMSRIRALPESILRTAFLLNEVPLSRRELKIVHAYCMYHIEATVEGHPDIHLPELPSVEKANQEVRSACDRRQDDGAARHARFMIPEGHTGITVDYVDFYVSVKCFLLCVFANPNFYYINEQWTDIMTVLVELLQDQRINSHDNLMWEYRDSDG